MQAADDFFMTWWYRVAMLHNRSVPIETLLPHISYKHLAEAIEWLGVAFGFAEHFRYGDPVAGAQLQLGNAWIMVYTARPGQTSPMEAGSMTQYLTVFIEDVDGHFRRALAAGASIVEEPHETVYGEYQYAADDPEGHRWLFSRHARDCDPTDWGAAVAGR
jgi:uncharacterized glyoxalase superfamily protein PhnB